MSLQFQIYERWCVTYVYLSLLHSPQFVISNVYYIKLTTHNRS